MPSVRSAGRKENKAGLTFVRVAVTKVSVFGKWPSTATYTNTGCVFLRRTSKRLSSCHHPTQHRHRQSNPSSMLTIYTVSAILHPNLEFRIILGIVKYHFKNTTTTTTMLLSSSSHLQNKCILQSPVEVAYCNLYDQLHFSTAAAAAATTAEMKNDLMYQEIMEACRPFYALEDDSNASYNNMYFNPHNLPPRLEDALALQQRAAMQLRQGGSTMVSTSG
jgi:hypothetical protein